MLDFGTTELQNLGFYLANTESLTPEWHMAIATKHEDYVKLEQYLIKRNDLSFSSTFSAALVSDNVTHFYHRDTQISQIKATNDFLVVSCHTCSNGAGSLKIYDVSTGKAITVRNGLGSGVSLGRQV